MDYFDASELVFNRTYFARKYHRTLKIKGGKKLRKLTFLYEILDAHISSFSNVDVPPSSGCFNFSKNNLGFENRFILWFGPLLGNVDSYVFLGERKVRIYTLTNTQPTMFLKTLLCASTSDIPLLSRVSKCSRIAGC